VKPYTRADVGAPGGSGLAALPPDEPPGCDIAALFRAHQLELVRLAFLLVGDRPTAEDVVQDVFAGLHARRLRTTEDGGLAYARAAVLNRCRSVLRRQATARRLVSDAGPDRTAAWAAAGGVSASAEGQALLAEDRREVLAALSQLPRRRREVLVLRFYLGLSEAQIAQTLGISAGTVKSNAARGLAQLARLIGAKS
jgi:RNA polymerase sigma factor (sigma-70 family)